MHGEENTRDDWQTCPSGELTRMVGRLGARERRARFRQLASTGLLSMLLLAAGTILVGGFVIYEEPKFVGGISCTYCLDHIAEYHDHLVGKNLVTNVEFVAKLKTHLKRCAPCRMKFQQAYSDVPLELLTKTDLRLDPLLPTFAVALAPAGY